MFGTAGLAKAYYISDWTNIGSLDSLIHETDQATINTFNGDEDGKVLAWVNSMLAPDTTFTYKNDPVFVSEFNPIFSNIGDTTPVAGGYAFELTSISPEYFLIKTGNVTGQSGDGNSYFLFDNEINMQWAVFTLGSMGFSSITNITGISHIEEYGGSVPEPATMLLFGTGLAGLAGLRLRKKM